jgi:hypothetical protein
MSGEKGTGRYPRRSAASAYLAAATSKCEECSGYLADNHGGTVACPTGIIPHVLLGAPRRLVPASYEQTVIHRPHGLRKGVLGLICSNARCSTLLPSVRSYANGRIAPSAAKYSNGVLEPLGDKQYSPGDEVVQDEHGCCCCPASVAFEGIRTIGSEDSIEFGHAFNLVVEARAHGEPPPTNHCRLKWRERFSYNDEPFGEWAHADRDPRYELSDHKKKIDSALLKLGCGGSTRETLYGVDHPRVGIGAAILRMRRGVYTYKRVLEIEVSLMPGSTCVCSSITATARQTIIGRLSGNADFRWDTNGSTFEVV